jgi:hypothetical protein
MKSLKDILNFLKRKPYVPLVVLLALVFFFYLIFSSNKNNTPPDKGIDIPPRGQLPHDISKETPPGGMGRKNGVAILYDVSESMPTLLMGQFQQVIQDANTSIECFVCQLTVLDATLWDIKLQRVPKRSFDVIKLIKMGEPNKSPPFFPSETVEPDNLGAALPVSRKEFKEQYTYLTLAEAVGAEALEAENVAEMYLLLFSDKQESKLTRPGNQDWSDFSAKFEAKYTRINQVVAYWKQSPEIWFQLIQLKRSQ